MSDPVPEPYAPRTPWNPRGHRRTVTTVVACLVLALGAFGLFASLAGVVSMLFVSGVLAQAPQGAPAFPEEMFTGALVWAQILVDICSKSGLVVIGILVLKRHPHALLATWITFAVSGVGSAVGLVQQMRVMAYMREMLESQQGAGSMPPATTSMMESMQWVGFGCVSLITAALYVGLILFLKSSATRAEWTAEAEGLTANASGVF